MAVLDRDGVILNVNAGWKRYAADNGAGEGVAATRTGIGVNYLEVCRSAEGADRESALQMADGIAEVLAGTRDVYMVEYQCASPTEMRWFQLSDALCERRSAGPWWCMPTSPRGDAEDALRESEAQYRSVVVALDEGILVFGTQGELKACNPRAERFFGRDFAALRDPQVLRGWRPVQPDGSMLRYADLLGLRTLRTGEPCAATS